MRLLTIEMPAKLIGYQVNHVFFPHESKLSTSKNAAEAFRTEVLLAVCGHDACRRWRWNWEPFKIRNGWGRSLVEIGNPAALSQRTNKIFYVRNYKTLCRHLRTRGGCGSFCMTINYYIKLRKINYWYKSG